MFEFSAFVGGLISHLISTLDEHASKAPHRRAIFPCQIFLHKLLSLVCTWKNWQVFLEKEPVPENCSCMVVCYANVHVLQNLVYYFILEFINLLENLLPEVWLCRQIQSFLNR